MTTRPEYRVGRRGASHWIGDLASIFRRHFRSTGERNQPMHILGEQERVPLFSLASIPRRLIGALRLSEFVSFYQGIGGTYKTWITAHRRHQDSSNRLSDHVWPLPGLPAELWLLIFEFLVESLPAPPQGATISSMDQLPHADEVYHHAIEEFLRQSTVPRLTLAMVCRQWRYLVTVRSPWMWRRIHFITGHVEVARLFFERSGELPLEIHHIAVWGHDFSSNEVNEMASLFARHGHRVRVCGIHTDLQPSHIREIVAGGLGPGPFSEAEEALLHNGPARSSYPSLLAWDHPSRPGSMLSHFPYLTELNLRTHHELSMAEVIDLLKIFSATLGVFYLEAAYMPFLSVDQERQIPENQVLMVPNLREFRLRNYSLDYTADLSNHRVLFGRRD